MSKGFRLFGWSNKSSLWRPWFNSQEGHLCGILSCDFWSSIDCICLSVKGGFKGVTLGLPNVVSSVVSQEELEKVCNSHVVSWMSTRFVNDFNIKDLKIPTKPLMKRIGAWKYGALIPCWIWGNINPKLLRNTCMQDQVIEIEKQIYGACNLDP